jgi:hypothetical protein
MSVAVSGEAEESRGSLLAFANHGRGNEMVSSPR